ncbi:MAG: glycosyltransferase family 39 protein [Chitinophagales bacterium]|nr:glycosyltransferase family 39 protein [Chitinophagales bacterium]
MNVNVLTAGRLRITGIGLLAVIIYFPLFLHLTSYPIRLWDESRLAVNAAEMAKSGNWIVTTYDGAPDMWNTKPPLMIWMQVICIHLFGLNELAIRFPAAICGVLTCAMLFLFADRYVHSYSLGFIATVVLVSSAGYIMPHVERTGDYDAMLVFLTTFYLLCFFILIESEQQQKNFLLFFFIGITLALLCKGIAGLLFLPSLIIYAFARRKVFSILRNRSFYIGISLFFLIGGGYYLIREIINPGYFKAVLENEAGGRYLHTIEDHKFPFWFYINQIIDSHYSAWYLLIPCGIVIGLFYKQKMIRRLSAFLVLCVLQYILIISSAQTKLKWYDAPIYPLLALITGIFLNWIYEVTSQNISFSNHLKYPVGGLILMFFILILPYSHIIDQVYSFKNYSYEQIEYEIPIYLQNAIRNQKNLNNVKIICPDYPANILFYIDMLKENHQAASFAREEDIKQGDTVMVAADNIVNNLQAKYNVSIIDAMNQVKVFRIISSKQ